MPSPAVDIDSVTPGAVTYAGNDVTLRCVITLLGGVTENDVTVSSRWTKDGAPFSGVSGRVTLTSTTRLISIAYFTQLMFSPLSSSMDNGTYTCTTSLTPRQPQFVTGNSTSASFTLAVEGEVYLLRYLCGSTYLYLVVKYIPCMVYYTQVFHVLVLWHFLYGVE